MHFIIARQSLLNLYPTMFLLCVALNEWQLHLRAIYADKHLSLVSIEKLGRTAVIVGQNITSQAYLDNTSVVSQLRNEFALEDLVLSTRAN